MSLHFPDEYQLVFFQTDSQNMVPIKASGQWEVGKISRPDILAVIQFDRDYVPTVSARLISQVGEGQ